MKVDISLPGDIVYRRAIESPILFTVGEWSRDESEEAGSGVTFAVISGGVSRPTGARRRREARLRHQEGSIAADRGEGAAWAGNAIRVDQTYVEERPPCRMR